MVPRVGEQEECGLEEMDMGFLLKSRKRFEFQDSNSHTISKIYLKDHWIFFFTFKIAYII